MPSYFGIRKRKLPSHKAIVLAVVKSIRPQRWQQPPWGMSQERTLTMDEYKTCSKCGQTKPYSDWGKNKSKKDGLASECKACHAASSAAWRKANPDEQKRRSREQFAKSRERENLRRRKWYWNNREYAREMGRRYYEETAEKQRQTSRDWRKNNPDKLREQNRRTRAKRAAVPSEPYTEKDILNRWGTNCHLCGEPIDLNAPRATFHKGWERGLQLDHVIPISANGPDIIENVKPSHGKCNISKGYIRGKSPH